MTTLEFTQVEQEAAIVELEERFFALYGLKCYDMLYATVFSSSDLAEAIVRSINERSIFRCVRMWQRILPTVRRTPNAQATHKCANHNAI